MLRSYSKEENKKTKKRNSMLYFFIPRIGFRLVSVPSSSICHFLLLLLLFFLILSLPFCGKDSRKHKNKKWRLRYQVWWTPHRRVSITLVGSTMSGFDVATALTCGDDGAGDSEKDGRKSAVY